MRRFSGPLSFLLLSALGLVLPTSSAEALHRTAAAAPSAVLATNVIGTSVQGRPIKAYRIGDATAPVKAVFIGGIHGNESQPSKILLNLMSGPTVRGAAIWVIPRMNPDGIVHQRRSNARGVDLNRNFPVDWVRQPAPYYSGPGPASEPETRAVLRFLRSVDPDRVVILHQPLYGVDNSYAKAHSFAYLLSRGLHLPRKVFTCNSVCRGTLTQWFNATQPGQALTVEYGKTVTNYQQTVTGPTGLLYAIGATRRPAGEG